MKIPPLLNRLKNIKKRLKGARSVVVVVAVTILLASTVSVVAYTSNLQKKEQSAVETMPSKATTPPSKVQPVSPSAGDEKPAASDDPLSTASSSTPAMPVSTVKTEVKQPAKPRLHTSEDPAFVICTQKYSDLYVQYEADIERINAEKTLALATLDELYNTGFYADMDPIEGNPYNQWQIDRAELVAHYDDQLANLNSTYAANSSMYLNC